MTDAEFKAVIASIENATSIELKTMFIETLDDHIARRPLSSVPAALLPGHLMDLARKAGLPANDTTKP